MSKTNTPQINDKGEKSNFAVEKLSKYDFSQKKSQLIWPILEQAHIMCLLMWCAKWECHFRDIPAKKA